jgi:Delta3-Delta2-enoyl-CoA isomerase
MCPPTLAFVRLQLLQNGQIALVEFNRPESGNSLFPQLLSDMVSVFTWLDTQPLIRVIIQTGVGRFFCTGMDLTHSKTMSFAIGSDFHELNRLLISTDKILIAAVNGPAVGYGVSILALFDLVYSAPQAYFFTPFVKWGMAAEGASSFAFPRLMGHQRAAALFFTGERVTATEAQILGLVNKILPEDGMIQIILDKAKALCQSPLESLKATKALMKKPVMQQLLDANDRECFDIHNNRFLQREYNEAVKQFKIEQNYKQKLKSRI